MSIDKRSVPVSLLTEGMILKSDIYSKDQLLLKKNLPIKASFIERLRNHNIKEVEVSIDEALLLLHQQDLDTSKSTDDVPYEVYLAKNKKLKEIYDRTEVLPPVPEKLLQSAKSSVTDVFNRLWNNEQSPDFQSVQNNVNEIVEQILSTPNTAPKLMSFCSYDEYTFLHSINVGVLFAYCLVEIMPENAIKEFAYAATLHDIGKTKIPLEIINKTSKLSEEEFQIMQNHPDYGVQIVKEEGLDIHPYAIKIIQDHHQKYDGTGYPGRKTKDEVNMQSFLGAVCDVYDALTTRRSYKEAMPFNKAIQIILNGSGSHFHPEVVNIFLKRVGLYPLGTILELDTHEIGIVVDFDKNTLEPTIELLYDNNMNQVTDKRTIKIELNQQHRIVRSYNEVEFLMLTE